MPGTTEMVVSNSEYLKRIKAVIIELERLLDDRWVSDYSSEDNGGEEHPGPIDECSPELYKAVQSLEQIFPDKKLPFSTWKHWRHLLKDSRISDVCPVVVYEHAISMCESLRALEVNRSSCPVISSTLLNSDWLDLEVNLSSRTVSSKKNSCEISFSNKEKQWQLFYVLFSAEKDGLSRRELIKEIWSDGSITENAFDKQKERLNNMLAEIRIEVSNRSRGIWVLKAM